MSAHAKITPLEAPKRLPETLTYNHYQFDQLCRTEKTAIYVQHIKGRQKAFEVISIGMMARKPVRVNGGVRWESCEPYERYPGSEAWGVSGWTYTTIEAAREKYDQLNQSGDLPGDLPSKMRSKPPRAPLGFAASASEDNGRVATRAVAKFEKRAV